MSGPRPAYRARWDRVPMPPPASGGPDNVDRLIAGVRIVGHDVVHAVDATGALVPCGRLPRVPRNQLVFTTAPVSCGTAVCASYA